MVLISGRPLLYLSLPGVAFILGVFWFRRRNKNRLEKDADNEVLADEIILHKTSDSQLQQQSSDISQPQSNSKTANSNNILNGYNSTTQSMNINGMIYNNSDSEKEVSPNSKLFGKSAPIKIQNGRTSNGKHQNNQHIDSEILKTKIQDAEHKLLCSIDEDFENLSSPVDLPDSVNNRVSFYTRTPKCKNDEPVVIKATRTPKISPENSFMESNYTKKGCEQNNNNDSNTIESHEESLSSPLAVAPVTNLSTVQQGTTKSEENADYTESGIQSNHESQDLQSQKDIIVNKIEIEATQTQKRSVDSVSPSLSLCSVQSGDSGKGSSLPRSEATRVKKSYAFFFPNSLIGQLYGRKRIFINEIKAKTLASVSLSKSRHGGKVRICTVEGTESEITAALAMIRQRLPVKRYPNFTMQRIHYALPQTVVPLSTESLYSLQIKLIEGINNDVVVSAVLTGSHIFIQQPLHPSHPSLAVLQKCLYESYNNTETPTLPGIELTAVCVVAVNGIWYRVQIVDQDEEDNERCIVKFLDFGGYMNVHFNDLRQIRSDFMGVPFQATECILSNIEPIDTFWPTEAIDVLSKLTKGIVLQAQVAGYNSHNIPEIYLFASLGPNNVIFINKELVARKLARWVETE